jgi:hypothetical protein
VTIGDLGSHLFVFATGVASGVAISFFSTGLTEWRQEHKARRRSRRTFKAVRSQMPELIGEMRNDIVMHPNLREFLVLQSSQLTLNTGNSVVLRYDVDAHPSLNADIHVLENHGYVSDVTTTNVHRYRMSEAFVDLLMWSK